MVCPHCHSDHVITVQDQHFCINCGQVVPDPAVAKKLKSVSGVSVGADGLPEGVKILPVGALASPLKPDPAVTAASEDAAPDPAPEAEAEPEPQPDESETPATIVKQRSRMSLQTVAATDAKAAAKPKKRKVGRPKAGRLDVPKVFASTAPAVAIEPTPVPVPTPEPEPAPATGPRTMSDLAPRRVPKAEEKAKKPVKPSKEKSFAFTKKAKEHTKDRLHHVGVPPLHYGEVIKFSLRAQGHPTLVAMAGLAMLGFAAALGYGVWLALHGGLVHLADSLVSSGPKVLSEIVLLSAVYYIGRSVAQTAITLGVVREADQRPLPLAKQMAHGINTFGRRLLLDAGFGLAELTLLILAVTLVLIGGESWPIDPQLQVAALFCAFMTVLYMMTSLALARGLAGVALTLTTKSPWKAAKLGWKLFSHRFELIALRFAALFVELLLIAPLAVLAGALIVSVPSSLHVPVAIGVGLLSWVAGALCGAGTAAWWAAMYRRVVLTDRPADAVALLSGAQPSDASRGPLTLIVALSSFLIAAALATPWLGLV